MKNFKSLIYNIDIRQLFYLITDLYKEGNGKEMRKWAYEIHSSFLGPGAVSIFFLILNIFI